MRFLFFPALAVGATLICGCGGGGGGSSTPNPGPISSTNGEPTAGNWKTVVLASSTELQSAAPPASSSAQDRAELNEVLVLQNGRTSAEIERVNYWDSGSMVRWNEIARAQVSARRLSPPVASRLYANMSAAQYDALVATYRAKYQYNRKAPARRLGQIVPIVEADADPSYPNSEAAIAASGAAILKKFFPDGAAEFDALANENGRSRMIAGVATASDVAEGNRIGTEVAARVATRMDSDLSNTAATPLTPPDRPGTWNGATALLPGWGRVKTWFLTDGSQVRPPENPIFGTPEYQVALAEVRQISDTRTPEQLAIAQFWADAAGTFTPPGHWNLIASDLIGANKLNEIRAARTLMLLNLAEMDAGIACWDTKYNYWLLRPSQADPGITLPIGLPPFPSYTSGHSTFSGAAETVLGYIFPDQAKPLNDFAEEASISRIYGGIHYRFDCEVGLQNGRQIGDVAVAFGRADGSPAVSTNALRRSVQDFKELTRRNLRPNGAKPNAANWD